MATKSAITDLFFEPIKRSVIDPSFYNNLAYVIRMCKVFSQLNNQSIYLIDYHRQEFLYVSPHPLFLCGYAVEEVKEMGYSFYEKILSKHDLQMLMKINRMGWNAFYDSTTEERLHSHISYDFYLNHKDGTKILVNQKVAPLFLSEDGNIWIGICVVNYSPNKKEGNVIFTKTDNGLYFHYDIESKKTMAYELGNLTKREEEVLRLSIQGYSETEISQKLHISANTVKNHRRHAEEKLGVNNLTNAVSKFNMRIQ